MKDGEEIRDYLKRAEKNWEEHTGNRHDSSPSMTILYIDQCQKGLPASIQEKLDDVVGLESKSEAEWKQHITHWWRSCDKKKSTEREDLDKITSILLNQQLTDKNAQQKAKTKQILVTTPAPSPTDIQLTVDTAVAKAVQQAQTANAQPPATPPPPSNPNGAYSTSVQRPLTDDIWKLLQRQRKRRKSQRQRNTYNNALLWLWRTGSLCEGLSKQLPICSGARRLPAADHSL